MVTKKKITKKVVQKENAPQLIIGPASKKQEQYINSDLDVVVFGGGAG
jgi:hypothetical protein